MQSKFRLLLLLGIVLVFHEATANTSTSTSFIIRQDIDYLAGLGTSTNFNLYGSGQNAPGESASTTFKLRSGSFGKLFNPLIPIYEQTGFHWRNDDGSESGATSATGGTENLGLSNMQKNIAKRLRFSIKNGGGTQAQYSTQQFRIEYGLQNGTCSASSYVDIGAAGGDWDMASTTTNLSEGGNTTNISIASGGITDTNNSFLASNGGQRKISSQTGPLLLPSDKFTELEYAIVPLSTATSTAPYCFRLTNSGVITNFLYSRYPTSTVSGSTNSSPAVSAILVNGGSPITLNANATTSITVGFTITDNNGCSDVFTGGGVTTTLFRSGAGSACTANNLNCYITNAQINNCTSGNTATATATIPIYYFAEPTDASSTYSGQSWQAKIIASDAGGLSSSSTSSGVTLNTLLAINLSTSTINYGTVGAGSNTGSTNQTISIQNVGNSSSTLRISGTDLTFNANIVPASSQHYATNTFTYNISDTPLNSFLTTVAGFFLTKPTSTAPVAKNLYWGISAPPGNPIGTYNGTNTITATWSN